jgi:hypothetical protein
MKHQGWALIFGAAFFIGGCAASPYSVSPQRDNNRLVYTHSQLGQSVVVEIDAAFQYEGKVRRVVKDVPVEGFVFTGPSGRIYATRLFIDEFETITGIDIPEAGDPARRFPSGTFYNKYYCELTRAHAAALGDEIVLAAYKKSLLSDGITCETIDTIDALTRAHPNRVEKFIRDGDRNIRLRLN